MDQHTCADGSEYLRFEFRVPEEVDTDVIDAEFIFLAGQCLILLKSRAENLGRLRFVAACMHQASHQPVVGGRF